MRQQESDQTIDQIMELLSELQKASTFSKVEETSKKLTIAISELTHQAEIGRRSKEPTKDRPFNL